MGGIKQSQDAYSKNAFGEIPQVFDNSLKVVGNKETNNQKCRRELNFYVIVTYQLNLVS